MKIRKFILFAKYPAENGKKGKKYALDTHFYTILYGESIFGIILGKFNRESLEKLI